MSDDEALVDRCRLAARELQHGVRSQDAGVARAAAVRLVSLPKFQAMSLEALTGAEVTVTRGDALDVIAGEHGCKNWAALVARALPELRSVSMHSDRMGAFLNRWFTSYTEAAAARRAGGGYLLPYRRQFFVTVADAVRELGLDPGDPDWERIGYDWVRPLDVEAHLRLCRARREVLLARGDRS